MTVIANFHGISTERFLYGNMVVIQCDIQGQKVTLKVKFLKIFFFNKYK